MSDQAAGAAAGTLSLEGLTRRFGDHAAVDGVSLDVARGELLALVGASGSGKTTTLRMVAGYERPDGGRISIDGKDITALPPQRRDFGMVFQHYALFPHMSVGENVAFGLEARGVGKAERLERASRALANVGLEGAIARGVQSLSGGEQQRVALARALVIEPRVLLLDEPLSNLDPMLRRSTREELRATLRELGVTALFVTHDQEDAFAVADRVALLEHGRLLQVGSSEDLYDRPASRQVAEFIGHGTLIPATLEPARLEPATLDGTQATLTIGGIAQTVAAVVPPEMQGASRNASLLAILRPDAIDFERTGNGGWPGIVSGRRFAGALLAYRVRLADDREVELYSAHRDVREGDRVTVRITREPVAIVAA